MIAIIRQLRNSNCKIVLYVLPVDRRTKLCSCAKKKFLALHFDHLLQIVVRQKGQAVLGVLQDLRFDACIRYAHANP